MARTSDPTDTDLAHWLELVFPGLILHSCALPAAGDEYFGRVVGRKIRERLLSHDFMAPASGGRFTLTLHGHSFSREQIAEDKPRIRKVAACLVVKELEQAQFLQSLVLTNREEGFQFAGDRAAKAAWPLISYFDREVRLMCLVLEGHLNRLASGQFMLTEQGSRAVRRYARLRDSADRIVRSLEPRRGAEVSSKLMRHRLQTQKDALVRAKIPEEIWRCLDMRLQRLGGH